MTTTENLTEIFHELKNPLATIKINIDLMKETPNHFDKNIKVIDNELTKLDNLLSRYLTFNSTNKLEKDVVYFSDVLKTIIKENAITYPNIAFHINDDSDISLLAFEYHIYMVFSNIIKNSIEAINGFGEIEISISEKEGIAQIEITDTGSGITKETQGKLSQGFTTKQKGSGLGTIIIRNILNIYNGEFTLIGQNIGAKAIVKIPIESY